MSPRRTVRGLVLTVGSPVVYVLRVQTQEPTFAVTPPTVKEESTSYPPPYPLWPQQEKSVLSCGWCVCVGRRAPRQQQEGAI